MHPILARGGRLALYLALWALVGRRCSPRCWRSTGGLAWTQSLAVAMPLAVTYAFFCLSAWYVVAEHAARGDRCRSASSATALTRRRDQQRRLAGCSRAAGSRCWRGGARARRRRSAFDRRRTRCLRVRRAAVPAVAGGQLPARIVRAVARDASGARCELQVLAREAELRALRAQIDPHFLFNSLHSISALTAADAAGGAADVRAARRISCATASRSAREDRIPLARELALAERFLAIERVRFGDRLRCRLDAGGAGGVPGAAAAAAAARRERGDARHRAPARRRHDPRRRRAAPRRAARSWSRTRAIPTVRGAPAPASAWRNVRARLRALLRRRTRGCRAGEAGRRLARRDVAAGSSRPASRPSDAGCEPVDDMND